MNNINKIILSFENLEEIEIDIKYIGYLYAGKLSSYVTRTALNSISKIYKCNKLCIEISKESNLKTKFDETYFNRIINGSDITAITFVMLDSEETYYFPYEEEIPNTIGSKNLLQSNFISDNGNLYITINCELKDYLSLDEINSNEYNKIFELYK